MGGSINNVDRLVRTMTSPVSRRGRGSVGDVELARRVSEGVAITGMRELAPSFLMNRAVVHACAQSAQNSEQVRTWRLGGGAAPRRSLGMFNSGAERPTRPAGRLSAAVRAGSQATIMTLSFSSRRCIRWEVRRRRCVLDRPQRTSLQVARIGVVSCALTQEKCRPAPPDGEG
jgi:hypothetical protein